MRVAHVHGRRGLVQNECNFNWSVKGRNVSETMSYLPGMTILLMVIAPLLVPLFISGAHLIANCWRSYRRSLSITPLRLARSSKSP
jgi:hypothetical protein